MAQPSTSTFIPESEDVRPDIMCTVCRDPWNDPVELRPCNHIFCKGCVAPLTTCPECRSIIKQRSLPNRIIINMASKVRVKCEQCPWRGTRGEAATHACPNAPPPPPKKKQGFFSRLLFGSEESDHPPPPAAQQHQQASQSQFQPVVPQRSPSDAAPPPQHQASHATFVAPPSAAPPQFQGRQGEEWMYNLFDAFPALDPDLILDICRTAGDRDQAMAMLSVFHAEAAAHSPAVQAAAVRPPVAAAHKAPLVPTTDLWEVVEAPPPPAARVTATKAAPATAASPQPPRPAPSKYVATAGGPTAPLGHYAQAQQQQQPQAVAPPPSAPAPAPAAPAFDWDPFDPRVGARNLAEYEAQARARGAEPSQHLPPGASPTVPSTGEAMPTTNPQQDDLHKLIGKFAAEAPPEDFDAPLFQPPPAPAPASTADPDSGMWRPSECSTPPRSVAEAVRPQQQLAPAHQHTSTGSGSGGGGGLRADSWDRPLTFGAPTPVATSAAASAPPATESASASGAVGGTFDDIFAKFAGTE